MTTKEFQKEVETIMKHFHKECARLTKAYVSDIARIKSEVHATQAAQIRSRINRKKK